MLKWFMKAGLGGYLNWVWVAAIAAVIALLITVVKIADARHENTIAVAEKAGAATAIAQGQQQTLEQVKDAKNAADEIRNDVGFARYCGCLQDAAPGFERSCNREIRDKSLLGDAAALASACARAER
jgi:heme exporter protein D